MSDAARLQIAIQKSGRLAEESIALLKQCGISLTRSKDQLFCKSGNFPVDVYFVRDDDIPAFIAGGVCQIGMVGQNVLFEKQYSGEKSLTKNIETLLELGFGKCRLSLAVPHDFEYVSPAVLSGRTIATSYPGILAEYLKFEKIEANIVKMEGAVEIAPRTKLADAICDLVSTGATLATNGLTEKNVILQSQCVLIRNASLNKDQNDILDRLLLRLKGVLRARNSKYIMLHSPLDKLEAITEALPGTDSPTIVPLEGVNDRVAVHAVCDEEVFWETMEDLKAIGASDILVLPIEKMLD